MKTKLKSVQKGSISRCFAEFIVKYKWVFVALTLALTVACLVMLPRTKVVYDLSTYLPAKSDANVAMQLLKDEFDDKGMLYVMVEDVNSVDDANALSSQIQAVEGIANVSYDPRTNLKNGKVLFTVSLTSYDSSAQCFDTVERLIASLDDSGKTAYFSGQSSSSYFTKLETEESILTLGVVIVAVILLMLLFTSRSYFELVIMVLTFGVAVAMSMGTNFLFDGISYVSNLVALVLQLALSIDYSVILMHRFMEERDLGYSAKESAINALTKGVPEILSSSLTTIAGLCSLMFMTLPIGVEIGLSLAKSIVFSMASVIFFMPALLVLFAKPLDKTRHKSFVPNVTKPARQIVKARKVIVPLFLVVVLLSCVGQFYNTYSFNMNGGSKIVNSQAEITPDFGTLNSLVVIVPKGDYERERKIVDYVTSFDQVDSSTALSTIEAVDGVLLTDEFTKAEFVATMKSMMGDTGFDGIDADAIDGAIGGIFDSYLAENGLDSDSKVMLIDLLSYVYFDSSYSALLGEYKDMLGSLVFARANLESEHYARLTFNVSTGVESDSTFALIRELKSGLAEYSAEFYITGESVVCYDMASFFPQDNAVVSVCTLVFILLILLFTFRSFALPVILALAIQGGIWINFVIPFLGGNMVSFIGYLIICAVQMGATIDYAIVLTNRYQTTKRHFRNRFDAMASAQNAVFPTIITSGIILIVTGFALGIAASGVVAQLGSLLGIGATVSVLVVLFVLPSLLLVTEKFYTKLAFKRVFSKKGTHFDDDYGVDNFDFIAEGESETGDFAPCPRDSSNGGDY